MSFLDRFPAEARLAFEQAATVISAPRGSLVMRKGEPGGDVYYIRRGALEVVRSRRGGEDITGLPQGSVVGEFSFLDGTPRSADVRVALDSELLRWSRDELRGLLARRPDLAAAFYEGVSRIAASRIRAMNDNAAAIATARVTEEARAIAEYTKEQLLENETRLRQDPSDAIAQDGVRSALDRLEDQIHSLFIAHPEIGAIHAAGRVLSRELHPYFVRSALAERCIRRHTGVSGAPDILAHVLNDAAGGDGHLGEIIDRWLLDRPMLKAIRRFREPILDLVSTSLPTHRNRRVLVIPATSLVTSLSYVLNDHPTVLSVADASRDVLSFYVDAGSPSRAQSVDLRPVDLNIAAWANARDALEVPTQDAIVLQGLIEYLPDRLTVATLQSARRLLKPGGQLITTALLPSPDQDLLDVLLNWPSIRRSAFQLARLFQSAGLAMDEYPMHPPALLLVGRVPGGGAGVLATVSA
jgi:CRP-like cAMP-binding protein